MQVIRPPLRNRPVTGWEITDMRRQASSLLLGIALTGCAVGPDYERPEVAVPASYRYAIGDTAAAANSEWWKDFGDPVLQEHIATALEANSSIEIASLNVEIAAGVFTTTRSPLFPQLGYEGGVARQSLPDASLVPGAVNPATTYQAFATASWEIDLWGRIRRQTEAARADLYAAEYARRGVLLTLVSAVTTVYLNLRALDEQLIIAQRTRDAYAESVRLFELQFEYGVVSEMTVQQARSQYETAAAFIPQVEQQIAVTENALALLLGGNPGPVARGKSIAELKLPVVPEGLPADLLERRPDIAEAEQKLIAANAQIGAAKALYFPGISLTGFLGGSSDELSNLFEGSAKTWNFTGLITGPIFTGGGIAGLVRQNEALQQIALENYESVIENAFAEVENALSSRVKLIEQVAAKQRLVDALQGYARLARLQYDGGYTSYLTVLDAQQQLFPAELDLVLTRAQLLNTATDIYKATGGGWINIADQMAPQQEEGGWLAPAVGTAALPPDGGVASAAGSGAPSAVTSPLAPATPVPVTPAVAAPAAPAAAGMTPAAGQ